MAEHLARIIGTEEDRVNCPFYWKIGACRHGDQCSRSHYKPTSSQTVVLRHMYRNPPVALAIAEGQDVDDDLADQAQDHFESFYEEVFEELANYGQIEEMVICDNIGDHMIGNVYVKYASEDDAAKAASNLSGRYYAGRIIECEFSPVTDFREARCRQFVDGQCTRGGYCNFMHMKHVPRSLKRKMIRQMFEDHPDYKRTTGMFAEDPSRGGGRYDRRGGGADHGGGGLSKSDNRNPRDDRFRRDRYRDDRDYRSDRFRERDDYSVRRRGGEDFQRDFHRESRDSRDIHQEDLGEFKEEKDGEQKERGGRGVERQSSQERRAMIAQWNQEAEESK